MSDQTPDKTVRKLAKKTSDDADSGVGAPIRQKPWKVSVLTLFPGAFPGVLGASIIGSALKDEKWCLETIDIRDFSYNKHRSVDTTPVGGGAGMVIRPDVSAAAIDSVARTAFDDVDPRDANPSYDETTSLPLEGTRAESRPLLYLTPRGAPLTQKRVRELASGDGVIVFCGRFEGLDQRVIEGRQMEEVSIGDYVLAGGEVAAQVLIEACVRLLPGVLGDATSADDESFEDGLLEYPLYAKPRTWEGRDIPPVLLSGNHGAIASWRLEKKIEVTQKRRPDLWSEYQAKSAKSEDL